MGCPGLPGENCGLESVTGPCTEYTDKWFYDMNYGQATPDTGRCELICVLTGGCARFWYGGCEAGRNHYETEAACEAECVRPRGSAVCLLPPVRGPCTGEYREWHYDRETNLCR